MVTQAFIRAVPWDDQRAANARALRRELGEATIVWDSERHAYETFIDALRFAASGPAIHLEDDAALTSAFRAKAEAVIAARPESVIQMFSRRAPDLTRGSRAEAGGGFSYTLAFYVPARLAGPLADFAPTWEGRALHRTGTDLAIAALLAERGESYWLTVPSLVQHRVWKSAIDPRRARDRTSRTFRP